MTAAQVYLVGPTVHPEADGLIGRTAGEIIFQMYREPLHWFPPEPRIVEAPTQWMS